MLVGPALASVINPNIENKIEVTKIDKSYIIANTTLHLDVSYAICDTTIFLIV